MFIPMKKKEESWTLLEVWTAYVPVFEIKWEFYVKSTDFTRCMNSIRELEEENKKLKEKIKRLEFDVDAWHQLKLLLEWEIEKLREENKNLREEMQAMERTLDHLGYWERTY